MAESLFSIVGHMFDDRRLSTSPVNLEEQVFLRMNNSLWNILSFVNINGIFELVSDETDERDKFI